MKRKNRNILFDDIKKQRRDNIIKVLIGILALVIISGLVIFLLSLNKEKPMPKDDFDANYIDPKFEVLTLKTISDFEKPTMNYNNYVNNGTFFGYFYKNNKIDLTALPDSLKVTITINKMFDCVNKDNKESCGIKIKDNTYQTSDKEVSKYAKLIFGEQIKIEHQTVEMPYGNIYNVVYSDNVYTFKQTPDVVSLPFKSYIDQQLNLVVENEQAILTKTISYVEEHKTNGQLTGYKAYSTNEKNQLLFLNLTDINTINDITADVKNKLKTANGYKYKVIFTKKIDGTYTFHQFELIPNQE